MRSLNKLLSFESVSILFSHKNASYWIFLSCLYGHIQNKTDHLSGNQGARTRLQTNGYNKRKRFIFKSALTINLIKHLKFVSDLMNKDNQCFPAPWGWKTLTLLYLKYVHGFRTLLFYKFKSTRHVNSKIFYFMTLLSKINLFYRKNAFCCLG